MARILIIDDHKMIRLGLRRILETREGWKIVGEVVDGEEALAIARSTMPDIAVVDYQLTNHNGVEVTRQLRRQLPATDVVMFTMYDHLSLVLKALEAGARGYVWKSEANEHLVSAIEAVASRRPYLSARISEQLARSFLSNMKHVGTLTPGERVVLQLIAEGYTDGDIAGLIRLPTELINAFRSAAMSGMGVNSKAEGERHA